MSELEANNLDKQRMRDALESDFSNQDELLRIKLNLLYLKVTLQLINLILHTGFGDCLDKNMSQELLLIKIMY